VRRGETVEAEAMPAVILRRLLREKIESFLPPRALEVARAAETSEREHLRRWADLMAGSTP
jgi:siroheme synthase (precorrin-2 oxidase/ferrochelatase)